MPARVTFADAGVAFDADGALDLPPSSWPSSASRSTRERSPRARRCRRSAPAPPSSACTRTRCARSTPRSRRRAMRRRATARARSRTCATRPGAAAVRRIADGALASARRRRRGCRARGARDPRRRRAGARSRARPRAARPREPTPPPAAPRRPGAARARERSHAPVLPPDILRGAHVGLVTGDAALVERALAEAERRGVRLRVAGPDDGQTLGDLVWGCELVIVGRDARDDESGAARAAQRARRARDGLSAGRRASGHAAAVALVPAPEHERGVVAAEAEAVRQADGRRRRGAPRWGRSRGRTSGRARPG